MQKLRKDKERILRQNFAEFVLTRRTVLGLSQAALAELIGNHQSYVTRLESGAAAIDSVPFVTIASALQVTEEELTWAICGLGFLIQLRNVDLLGVIKAIAESNLNNLSPTDLFKLLKVESNLSLGSLTMKKEMVPAFLEQFRPPTPD